MEAYSYSNELIGEYGFSISNTKSNYITTSQNYCTDIIVEFILTDVEYSGKIPDSMVNHEYFYKKRIELEKLKESYKVI